MPLSELNPEVIITLIFIISRDLLLSAGVFFIFAAALGIWRMPDIYMRMSTATKAVTLGVVCVLAAVGLHFLDSPDAFFRAVAAMIFFLVTTPVSAHMIGRAAYLDGEPLWFKTKPDQLAGYYEQRQKEGTLRKS